MSIVSYFSSRFNPSTPKRVTPLDVFAVRDRTGRVRALLHSVPLDFAVSSFTAAASTPHDANAPLWGGCVMTGHFPQNYFTLTPSGTEINFLLRNIGTLSQTLPGETLSKKTGVFFIKAHQKKVYF